MVKGTTTLIECYKSLVNTLSGHVYVKNLSGEYVVWNTEYQQALTAERYLTEKNTSLFGLKDADLFVHEFATQFRLADLSVIKSQKTLVFEEKTIDSFGQAQHFISIKRPAYIHDQLIGIIGRSFEYTSLTLGATKIKFTRREIQCLSGYYFGFSAKSISQFLKISPKTVESHIEKIKLKLACTSRSEVITLILKSNLSELFEYYISLQASLD